MRSNMEKDINILAIETSCDETAAAVVKNGRDVLSNVTALRKETKSLEKEIARVSNEEDLPKQTDLAKEKLVSGLEALRVPCDNLEKIIDKDLWKFPTYTDLLFKL